MGLLPLNEADTERLIVEPVLEALGYGPLDYRKRSQGVGADFPDYTILPLSERRWCLEVKEWEARLEERHERQAVNYANNNGAQWAVLTNGRAWRIYNTRAPGSLREMLAYEVTDILDARGATESLARLSRESVEGGDLDREYRSREIRSAVLAFLRSGDRTLLRTIQRGAAEQLDRNITVEDVEQALETVLGGPVPAPGVDVGPTPPEPAPPGQPLSATGVLALPALAQQASRLAGTKPASVCLPDGTETGLATWRDLAETVVQWLLDQGRVPALPFSATQRGSNYLLNAEPLHGDGEPMRTYRCFNTPQGVVYLDVHRSARNIVASVVALCQAVSQPPEGFRVSWPAE
jgi:hypothetical protein